MRRRNSSNTTRDPRRPRPTTRGSRAALFVAIVAAILGVAGIAVGLTMMRAQKASDATDAARAAGSSSQAPPSTSYDASATAAASISETPSVEVPSVIGSGITEAKIVLEAAGFAVRVTEGTSTAGTPGSVLGQDPEAGTVAPDASLVTLTVSKAKAPTASTKPKKARRLVVCIDPGHQERSDMTPEPIGPGSKDRKPSVTGGTTGVSTGLPEYEVALQISMNLKARLQKAGVKVVMTRTTNDVNLSNSDRAAIANKADADLFVRIHCDGNVDRKMSGISTLYPAKNKWTAPIASESKRSAIIVQRKLVAATGGVDRGAVARGDISGFNYSKVPSILIEAGFMSNSVEDRLLSSPHYQDKLASGMTDGILAALQGH